MFINHLHFGLHPRSSPETHCHCLIPWSWTWTSLNLHFPLPETPTEILSRSWPSLHLSLYSLPGWATSSSSTWIGTSTWTSTSTLISCFGSWISTWKSSYHFGFGTLIETLSWSGESGTCSCSYFCSLTLISTSSLPLSFP